MKRNRNALLWLSSVTGLAVVGTGVLAERLAFSQPPAPPAFDNRLSGGRSYKSEVKIEVKDGYRYITANGIPDHPTGAFPNAGNPNRIAPQSYHFRVPVAPKPSDRASRGALFGVAVNGVVFDPGTAELWNNDFRWHYEALTGLYGSRGKLGADENFAHVQPNGAYHYHGLPMGLLKKRDYQKKMVLVGYAADGYPIYGPYGYSNPNDAKSPLKMLKSSYRIKDGQRSGGSNGPGGAYDGSFASDYEFVKGLGDLDAYNGRVGVTPEYPGGTFYYVLTGNWPFVPRQFRGTPDPSFQKERGGGPGGGPPGGFGGPGGGPPGGGGPGGFGGPPGGGPPGGGFGGRPQGGPGGAPPGFVPADALGEYLELTGAQKAKLAKLTRVVDALRQENFALPAFARLKLTAGQIEKIAAGTALQAVLTAEQKKVLQTNQRPRFGGAQGGPGGFGGPPGGGPPGGGFGGPGGPPPGE
jgi:hypothetical protein